MLKLLRLNDFPVCHKTQIDSNIEKMFVQQQKADDEQPSVIVQQRFSIDEQKTKLLFIEGECGGAQDFFCVAHNRSDIAYSRFWKDVLSRKL